MNKALCVSLGVLCALGVSVCTTVSLVGAPAVAQPRPAAPKPARPAPPKPGAKDAGAPTATLTDAAAGAAPVRTEVGGDSGLVEARTIDGGDRVYKFAALEIEGRLKSPNLVYFLRRVRAEFAAGDLGHRTFMRELSETRKTPSF